jgi:hypothetical protein
MKNRYLKSRKYIFSITLKNYQENIKSKSGKYQVEVRDLSGKY